jgi:hypothetical protein
VANTWYIDLTNGVDANTGASFAQRLKTVGGLTAGKGLVAGDTARIMASADPTSLAQTATWTAASKTVTLTTAVTADIDTAELAWTASGVNVVCTTSAARKEGSTSASHAIAAAFTTGLAAFKTSAASNYSAYQQVSFWFQANATFTAGQLILKLCSDASGAVSVNALNLPAYPVANVWQAMTIDSGGALGASIGSVALYVGTDFGAVTCLIDNVIACKAPASADSLSLTSLIGKPHNLNWAASTTYAANDIRKPTNANRNGFRYKVTAGGGGSSGGSEPTWPTYIGATVTDNALTWTCDSLEETWYPIQSIRGTTILIDSGSQALATAGRGYHGTTESITTYKREPILMTPVTASVALTGAVQKSGSIAAGQVTYSGGWNTTDMTTQTGETWISGQVDNGRGMDANTNSFLTFNNLNFTRVRDGILVGTGTMQGIIVQNCHASGTAQGLIQPGTSGTSFVTATGVVAANNTSNAFGNSNNGNLVMTGRCIASHSVQSAGSAGIYAALSSGTTFSRFDLEWVEAKNNAAYAVAGQGWALRINNLITSNNATAAISPGTGGVFVRGAATISEATVVATLTAGTGYTVYLNNLNAAGAKNYHDRGTIAQATDQRHTASGYSWKFNPTSTTAWSDNPLSLSVAKIACSASVALTLGIWVRRDSTNIAGRLLVKGGQITGTASDVSVATTPTINTWTNYTMSLTPTATGVIDVLFECYDGVGTTNSLWIDDFSKT